MATAASKYGILPLQTTTPEERGWNRGLDTFHQNELNWAVYRAQRGYEDYIFGEGGDWQCARPFMVAQRVNEILSSNRLWFSACCLAVAGDKRLREQRAFGFSADSNGLNGGLKRALEMVPVLDSIRRCIFASTDGAGGLKEGNTLVIEPNKNWRGEYKFFATIMDNKKGRLYHTDCETDMEMTHVQLLQIVQVAMERMGLKVEVRIGINQLKVTVGDMLDSTDQDVQAAYTQLGKMKVREAARLAEIKRREERIANMGFSTRIGAC